MLVIKARHRSSALKTHAAIFASFSALILVILSLIILPLLFHFEISILGHGIRADPQTIDDQDQWWRDHPVKQGLDLFPSYKSYQVDDNWEIKANAIVSLRFQSRYTQITIW